MTDTPPINSCRRDMFYIGEAALLQKFRGLATGFAAALTGWVEIREVASALADGMISSRAIYPH